MIFVPRIGQRTLTFQSRSNQTGLHLASSSPPSPHCKKLVTVIKAEQVLKYETTEYFHRQRLLTVVTLLGASGDKRGYKKEAVM